MLTPDVEKTLASCIHAARAAGPYPPKGLDESLRKAKAKLRAAIKRERGIPLEEVREMLERVYWSGVEDSAIHSHIGGGSDAQRALDTVDGTLRQFGYSPEKAG